jgi:hypothetical protein
VYAWKQGNHSEVYRGLVALQTQSIAIASSGSQVKHTNGLKGETPNTETKFEMKRK